MKFDIDVMTLAKGRTLSPAELVPVVLTPCGTTRYRMLLVKLKNHIERLRADVGSPVVVAVGQDSLRVLTDAEAAVHTRTNHRGYCRKLKREYARARSVDRGELTDAEAAEHERQLARMGVYDIALSVAARKAARAAEPSPA